MKSKALGVVLRRDASASPTPAGPNPRRVRRQLLALALIVALVGAVVLTGPGLGSVRRELAHGSPGWLVAGVGLEVLSALSYVVLFRAVFCPRMSWRLSYQFGMSEEGANSVLSMSGAGGLAFGAWALRRGGMDAEEIGRKSVACFLLTNLPSVAGLITFAALYAVGVLGRNPGPGLTYGFAAGALVACLIVLVLPRLLRTTAERSAPADPGRVRAAMRFARHSLGEGAHEAVLLLRRGSPGVVLGSLGTVAFDLAVLGVCFQAFGHFPPLGVLVLGYIIGQIGGILPTPGGIGGLGAGLIGAFTAYHQPLAVSTAAVLVYHATALWVPGLLGGLAFVKLRRTLERETRPAAICTSPEATRRSE